MAQEAFPLMGASTWWKLRDKFAESLPKSVTTSYLQTVLGYASEKAARNTLAVLQRLGLVDVNNTPSGLANDWRIDETYPAACKQITDKVYPPELLDLFPEGRATDRDAIQGWMKRERKLGEEAARQAAVVFELLRGGLKLREEAAIAKPRKGAPPKSLAATPAAARPKKPAAKGGLEAAAAIDTRTPVSGPSLHIDLQIHISKDATPEQIDAIMQSIAKHLFGR